MEEKKKNKKKILIYSMLGIITMLIVTLTVTYAYWILTRQQTGENVVNTACLNISFSGENDITLDKAYPMNEEQLENFLSTATPYHFTIHNECSELASATINLESLNAEAEKQLQDEYINAILYENDYHANLNSVKQLGESIYNDENKVIEDSLHAYKLHSFTLKGGDTKEFNLLLYMDPDTPMEEDNMNASWKGKITLSGEYTDNKFINAGTIREIKSSDNDGMWGYKDKLVKLEIQDEIKSINVGDKIYGPFDESAEKNKSVESYVVCDGEDENCIGYLQGDGGINANSLSLYLFSNFSNVSEIVGLENINTSNVTNMAGMFEYDSSLSTLDLSMWDTSNVNNMSGIFSNLSGLTELNISNWDLSSIQSGSHLFSSTSSLNTVNMSNFTFPTDSSYFFSGVSNLSNLTLTGANTDHVTNMSYMFAGLNSLTTLDLKDFNTNKVTDMCGMFAGSNSISELDLSNFNTDSITNIDSMFIGMTNLSTLNISNWNLSQLSTQLTLFPGDANLTTVNMTNFVFPPNSSSLFNYGLTNLSNIILDNVDTSHITNMSSMFSKCSKLTSLDLSDWDVSHVTNTYYLFGDSGLRELNLSNWDLSSLDSSSEPHLFNNNTSLETLNMTNFIFPENSESLISGRLIALENLILDGIDTSHVTNMAYMFSECSALTSLDLSNFDTTNVMNYNGMFSWNTSLESITFGPKFTYKQGATTTSMFSNCKSSDRPSDNSWQGVFN